MILPTILSGVNITAVVVQEGARQTLKIAGQAVASVPDLIMKDGVVHKIEQVLLPPIFQEGGSKSDAGTQEVKEDSSRGWFGFLGWFAEDGRITVEQLMERLQPYVET